MEWSLLRRAGPAPPGVSPSRSLELPGRWGHVYLGKAGYAVTLAEDGADALMEIAKKSFDLVLSDIHMPNLDGMKLLKILSLQGVEPPVVFLSADESLEVEGLSLGAAEYLRKPVRKKTLLLRVRRILGLSEDPIHAIEPMVGHAD